MAYISFQPSDFFNNVLYTGTGSSNTVTGVGFQPDFTWIKNRGTTDGQDVYDSVRGAGQRIRTNTSAIEADQISDSLSAWVADGFTVLTNNAVNASANTYVSWNIKAGTTTGIAGSPSITPSSYSFNQTSGFSIIAYTGNGTAGATIPHGLGVVPDMVIVKKLSSTSDWFVYHSKIDATAPQDYYLSLNGTAGSTNNNGEWYDTAPTSTLVTLGANTTTNTETFIAYCFASIKGYSKFGSYTGNAAVDGQFIYTGFRPALVIIKRTSTTGNWTLWGSKRAGYNVKNSELQPNLTSAEDTTSNRFDLLSNGFKMRDSSPTINDGSYIYMAIAEFPLVSSNDVPGVAR